MCDDDRTSGPFGRRALLVTGAAAALTLNGVNFAAADGGPAQGGAHGGSPSGARTGARTTGEETRKVTGHLPVGAPDYVYLPVEVPPGVREIAVSYTYDRPTTPPGTAGNACDIGIFDERGTELGGRGFRGWSGGARTEFFLRADDATPGYLPGRSTPVRGTSPSARTPSPHKVSPTKSPSPSATALQALHLPPPTHPNAPRAAAVPGTGATATSTPSTPTASAPPPRSPPSPAPPAWTSSPPPNTTPPLRTGRGKGSGATTSSSSPARKSPPATATWWRWAPIPASSSTGATGPATTPSPFRPPHPPRGRPGHPGPSARHLHRLQLEVRLRGGRRGRGLERPLHPGRRGGHRRMGQRAGGVHAGPGPLPPGRGPQRRPPRPGRHRPPQTVVLADTLSREAILTGIRAGRTYLAESSALTLALTATGPKAEHATIGDRLPVHDSAEATINLTVTGAPSGCTARILTDQGQLFATPSPHPARSPGTRPRRTPRTYARRSAIRPRHRACRVRWRP